MAKSMSGQFSIFDLPTLRGSRNAISSQESASGPTLSDLPASQMSRLSGPDRAPVNLSARQAKAAGLLTSGTYGQPGTGSLSNADRSEFMASKLRALMVSLGSTLFTLTLKERATPSGRMIAALRASGRRISDSACSSWPTPQAHDQTGRSQHQKEIHGTKHGCSCLVRSAQMAAWPTPTKANGDGGHQMGEASATGRTPDGRKINVTLPGVAKLSTWPTPRAEDSESSGERKSRGVADTLTAVSRLASPLATPSARDWKDTAGMATTGVNPDGSERSRTDQLGRQAQLSGPARLTASGEMLTGLLAQMESGGQLSPAHSRWLMGLPSDWDRAAPLWSTPAAIAARRGKAKAARKCSKATETPS